jgi:tetratricopeptide (TPR) repeat protein
MALCRAVGDRRGEANVLGNLGIVYQTLGDFHQALSFFQAALKLDCALGDLAGQAADLVNLGLFYGDMGDLSHARAFTGKVAGLMGP